MIEQVGVGNSNFAWMIYVTYLLDLQRHIFVHEVNVTVCEQMRLEVEQTG
jgi:hypothetical protein